MNWVAPRDIVLTSQLVTSQLCYITACDIIVTSKLVKTIVTSQLVTDNYIPAMEYIVRDEGRERGKVGRKGGEERERGGRVGKERRRREGGRRLEGKVSATPPDQSV